MPRFDQTGPMGQCPMTGHRMGRCNAFGANQKNQNSAQSENPDQNLPENFAGRGFGIDWGRCGRGRGMGRQNRFRGSN
ncbi:MAG: DUF5320 domain-containing protein [Bacteroidetes bacterium]|nr:DUF5320 domain-containing protein [Bacteroidota bacterium]